ncbi:MAG: GGDEF domain-containing protein, partial [Thiovulaceae bacterium]|nr:GGDEF domain-containing protein [Sulfurimonadaceae bacterium]
MLLPEEKERALRFKLALRIGLPIFLLFIIASISLFSIDEGKISSYYIALAISIFVVMIYFIFYLIYQGQQERITDPITHTFSREYLSSYLKKKIEKNPYTILVVSVQNITDINSMYGVSKGDMVLYEVSHWVGGYLKEKGIDRVPIGHYKGSDFLIGLEGTKEQYLNLLDLMCLKFENKTIEEIEINFASAIIDTNYSRDLEQLTTRLFDLLEEKVLHKQASEEEEIDPTELESSVIHAVQMQSFSLMYQIVDEKGVASMIEASAKLINNDGKIIHQSKFMPVINRLGLTRTYDEIILEKVANACEKAPHHLIVALSISPSSVRNNIFFEKTAALLNSNEKARGRIMFVLSENEDYHDPKRYNKQLQAYKRLGIFIAIDNFGAFKSNIAL